MNDEYLWSKKGSDPEIESLEGLLAEFRFEPSHPPIFETVAPPAQPSFTQRFAWIIGIATPAAAVALLSFWILGPGPTGDLRVRADAVVSETHTAYETETGYTTRVSTNPDKSKTKSLTRQAVKRVKTVYKSRKPKADRSGSLVATRLTTEEKYAYERLMLALSIAGKKLKIVQDTVDGKLPHRSEK